MSKPTHRELEQTTQSASEDNYAAGFTRRTVLAGAAATTAAVTIGVDTPALAQKADPTADKETFLVLSAALTGIAKKKLDPFADPLNLWREYFNRANNDQHAAVFVALLRIAKGAALQVPPDETNGGVIPQDKVDQLASAIEARDETKFLARSIVLMWYLGSWYEPDVLKALTGPNPPPLLLIPHEVISPTAYTHGWLWRVAQAHPMGYSDMQFGYWTRPPQPLTDFIAVRPARGG